MKTAYVVRELVSLPAGENEFFTHYEYGTFGTYKEANQCAIATKNPRCFPQREEFLGSRQEDAFVNQYVSENASGVAVSGDYAYQPAVSLTS